MKLYDYHIGDFLSWPRTQERVCTPTILTSKKRIHEAKENVISAMIDPYTNCFSLVLSFKPNLALALMRELGRKGEMVLESLKATLESLMICSNLEALTTWWWCFFSTGFQCRSSQQICRDRERSSFCVDPVSEMRTRRFCALEGIEIWQQRTLGASDDAST